MEASAVAELLTPSSSQVVCGLKASTGDNLRIRHPFEPCRIGFIVLTASLRVLPDFEQKLQRDLV